MSDVDREALARRLVDERMAYYGYTPEQIAKASLRVDHYAAGCSLDGNGGWDCVDEYDKSFHPDSDEYDRTAEFTMWLLDEIEDWLAQVKATARAEAWDEAIQAVAWCLDNGEPSAPAALVYTAEHNPYRSLSTPTREAL